MQVTDEMLAAYKIAHRAAVDAALNDYSKYASISDDARRAGIKAALAAALSDKQAGEVKPCGWVVIKKSGGGVFMSAERYDEASAAAEADIHDRGYYPVYRSALVDVPAVEPEPFGYVYEHTVRNIALGGSHREFRFFKKRRSISDDDVNEFEITETAVYTNPPLREGEDSADVIGWQRVNDAIYSAIGLIKALCSDDIADVAAAELRYALAATRSGSATTAKGGAV